MKKYRPYIILLISHLGILISGCSNDSENQKFLVKAVLPENFVKNGNLGSSITVCELRKSFSVNDEIVVEGFIGGRRKPFSETKAIFILGDDSLETCDEKPDDSCPTPWDVCCEDRKKIANSTISIQVNDDKGDLLDGTLEDVSGIIPGQRIKVKGIVDSKSSGNAVILNAISIQLL